jgi:hypothetical protein
MLGADVWGEADINGKQPQRPLLTQVGHSHGAASAPTLGEVRLA